MLFNRIRSTAMYFWSSVNHLAVVGWAGNRYSVGKKSNKALYVSVVMARAYIAPVTRKIYWYR